MLTYTRAELLLAENALFEYLLLTRKKKKRELSYGLRHMTRFGSAVSLSHQNFYWSLKPFSYSVPSRQKKCSGSAKLLASLRFRDASLAFIANIGLSIWKQTAKQENGHYLTHFLQGMGNEKWILLTSVIIYLYYAYILYLYF